MLWKAWKILALSTNLAFAVLGAPIDVERTSTAFAMYFKPLDQWPFCDSPSWP